MIICCPLCGTALEVKIELDTLEVFSPAVLIARWHPTSLEHRCPDPDGPQPEPRLIEPRPYASGGYLDGMHGRSSP